MRGQGRLIRRQDGCGGKVQVNRRETGRKIPEKNIKHNKRQNQQDGQQPMQNPRYQIEIVTTSVSPATFHLMYFFNYYIYYNLYKKIKQIPPDWPFVPFASLPTRNF